MTIDLTTALGILAFVLSAIGGLVKIIRDNDLKRIAQLEQKDRDTERKLGKLQDEMADLRETVAGFGAQYVSRSEFA